MDNDTRKKFEEMEARLELLDLENATLQYEIQRCKDTIARLEEWQEMFDIENYVDTAGSVFAESRGGRLTIYASKNVFSGTAYVSGIITEDITWDDTTPWLKCTKSSGAATILAAGEVPPNPWPPGVTYRYLPNTPGDVYAFDNG